MSFFKSKGNSGNKSLNTELTDILRHVGIDNYSSQIISVIHSEYNQARNPPEKTVYVPNTNNPGEPIEVKFSQGDMSIIYKKETIYSTGHPEKMPFSLAVYLNPQGELGKLYKKNTRQNQDNNPPPVPLHSQYSLRSASPY